MRIKVDAIAITSATRASARESSFVIVKVTQWKNWMA